MHVTHRIQAIGLTSILVILLMKTVSGEWHWLRGGQLEAAFVVDRGIRLEVLREPGGKNLLREDDSPYRGMKTWVMMPSDIVGIRDMLSEEPAAVLFKDDGEIRMETKEPNPWGLHLEWVARLDPVEGELHLLQRIHNRGSGRLYLGLWTIAAVAPDTVLRIPFDRSPTLGQEHPNQIAVFPYTDLGDARIKTSRKDLQVQIRRGVEAGGIKLGLVQPEGRVQVIRGGSLFEMQSPYESDALYPEGGMNVTVYASGGASENVFGEAEIMGPLQMLEPGETMELPLVVRLGSVD